MVHGIGTTTGARGARCSLLRLLPRPSVAIAAIAVAVTTAACVRGSTPDHGEVVLSIGYAAAGESGELIAPLTGEGLLRASPDGRLEPLLAESWEIDPAGTTILINLRQDVSFHDGSPMTAGDVKASLDRARGDPRRPLLGDIESIEAQGAYAVSIRLARPSAQLLLFELGVRIDKKVDEAATVGTGPFRVETAGETATTLRASPFYYRGTPLVDVVHLRRYPTHRAAWAAMMRSEVDLLYDVPDVSREFVDADSSVRVFWRESPVAFALVFNTRRSPFDDPRLRVALSHAIDREAIIKGTFRGHASVASGVWPNHWVYGGVNLQRRHDPKRADRLLTQLGFERPSSIDPGAGEHPGRLRFETLVGFDQAHYERTALLIQRQLRLVGVEMEIDAKPFVEVGDQIATRPDSWDAVLLPVNTARNLTRLYTYWHSSGQLAVSGFTGADDALSALRLSVTDVDIQAAASEVQRILFEEAPAVFLATAEDARAVSVRFVVPREPGLDVLETLWQWRVAAETSDN